MKEIINALNYGVEFVKGFFRCDDLAVTLIGGALLVLLFVLGFKERFAQMLFAIAVFCSGALMIYDVTMMANDFMLNGELVPEHVIYTSIVYLISFSTIWLSATYRLMILAYSKEGADTLASKFIDFTCITTLIAVASSVVMLCLGWIYLTFIWVGAAALMLICYCFATK